MRKGQKHTPEAREKIRVSHLGKKLPRRTKEKIGEKNHKRVVSEETKAVNVASRRARRDKKREGNGDMTPEKQEFYTTHMVLSRAAPLVGRTRQRLNQLYHHGRISGTLVGTHIYVNLEQLQNELAARSYRRQPYNAVTPEEQDFYATHIKLGDAAIQTGYTYSMLHYWQKMRYITAYKTPRGMYVCLEQIKEEIETYITTQKFWTRTKQMPDEQSLFGEEYLAWKETHLTFTQAAQKLRCYRSALSYHHDKGHITAEEKYGCLWVDFEVMKQELATYKEKG